MRSREAESKQIKTLTSPSKQGTMLLVAAAETALRTREAWRLHSALVWSHSDVRPMMRHCISCVSTSCSTLTGSLQSWSRTWEREKRKKTLNETNTARWAKWWGKKNIEQWREKTTVNLGERLLKGFLRFHIVCFSWKAHEQVKTLDKSSREQWVYTGQNILQTHKHIKSFKSILGEATTCMHSHQNDTVLMS